MQTSRFQLGFMVALAVSLGFSLASSDAVGYPSSSVVSLGSNPLWSRTGTVDHCSTTDLLTVPSGQVAVVTGWKMSAFSYTDLYQDDTLLVSTDSTGHSLFEQNNGSLPVAGGTTLTLNSRTSCDYPTGATKSYYIQGYFTQE